MNLTTTFADSLRAYFPDDLPRTIAVAVSGGGDSIALLHLTREWGEAHGVSVSAVTVDHGLRPEAADEAKHVAAICAQLAIPHAILKWTGWDQSGNTQDQARRARIDLIGRWAREQGIDFVATGHTLDDQAETVLMRLGRGSGVDGLSGIPRKRTIEGVQWIRPLLDTGREELRAFLREQGIDWIEDPSNDDDTFGRVRARQAMSHLATLGITAQGLAETAKRMASARDVLEQAVELAARRVAKVANGDVSLKIDGLMALMPEIRRRLLSHVLNWVARGDYPPRAAAVYDLEVAISQGKSATLHGCFVSVGKDRIVVTREWNAVKEKVSDVKALWDDRWSISGPGDDGYVVAALGEAGLSECPNWRESGRIRAAVMASPAIWKGDELIAAPLAEKANGWTAKPLYDSIHFFSSILSH